MDLLRRNVVASKAFGRAAAALALAAWLSLSASGLAAQSPPQQNPQAKPQQPAPAPAGGPQGDMGPIAVPKKQSEPEKPEPSPKIKNPEGLEDITLRVDVPLVTLDVGVLTKNNYFVPNLKKENFRILEDGVPQKIDTFTTKEAPITAVLLVEFANTHWAFMYDALNASYTFASMLKPEDWIAVVAYDMRSMILADFSQDKRQVYDALARLRVPGFSETNLFDALYDTLDRLEAIEGRKYVVLISSGRDTFSRLRLDQILKKVEATKNTTIYAVGTGKALLEYADMRGMRPELRLEYLQAENQLRTFTKKTGGRAYFPRFQTELPGIFGDIANAIRNQYSLSYRPSNTTQDGKVRNVKIELVAPDGGPLKIVNEKGKEEKVQLIYRESYRAKFEVE